MSIKTVQSMLKQDKERYTVPHKVQDIIPIRRIWSDGIFMVGSKFSKAYQFTDINYQVASRAMPLSLRTPKPPAIAQKDKTKRFGFPRKQVSGKSVPAL